MDNAANGSSALAGSHVVGPHAAIAGDSQPQSSTWPLVLGSMGVVYGDIGTSPLYAFREAVNASGFANRIRHISTGGGASLEFISGAPLPGVEVLRVS